MDHSAAGFTVAAALVLALGGCYVLPLAPDGQPLHPYLQSNTGGYPYAGVAAPVPPAASTGPQGVSLQARLYPANAEAAHTGVLGGTVTNMLNGKGRFHLQYKGETLTGEATRVDGDQRRGVASAYGAGGGFMSCEYQMHTARQGAGTCVFSSGAKYQVHIGM